MRSTIRSILSVLLMLGALTGVASAGFLRSAIAAYDRSDYVTAARLLEPLATRGNATAQGYLGFMYSMGRGVPKNAVAAAWWTQRAANQGNTSSQYLLGLMYDKAQGVPQDYVEAYKWLSIFSAHAPPSGLEYGARIRDAVATKMTVGELAEAQRRSLQWAPVRE